MQAPRRITAPVPAVFTYKLSRLKDRTARLQLHFQRKFDAVACCEGGGAQTRWDPRRARRLRLRVSGPPESTTQKGTCMKCASVVKVAAAAAVAIGLVG